MKAMISTLAQRPVRRLRIRSLGLGLYTAEVALDEGWVMVCNDDGQVLQFSGMEWLRRRLGHLQVAEASLLHASAYHEMIGLAEEAIAPMEVPVSWPGDQRYN